MNSDLQNSNLQNSDRQLEDLVRDLDKQPGLQARVMAVLAALPAEVQLDFLQDQTFYISLEMVTSGQKTTTFMSLPPGGVSSRCVILRAKLARASEAFASYVIAHELAHAFLRNGPWGPHSDREHAADALAKHWGYPRPY